MSADDLPVLTMYPLTRDAPAQQLEAERRQRELDALPKPAPAVAVGATLEQRAAGPELLDRFRREALDIFAPVDGPGVADADDRQRAFAERPKLEHRHDFEEDNRRLRESMARMSDRMRETEQLLRNVQRAMDEQPTVAGVVYDFATGLVSAALRGRWW